MAVELITQSELARRLGVSRAAVNQAVKAGRITLADDGRLDSVQAIEQWRSNTRAVAERGAPAKARGGQPKYASARARKEHHLANIAAIQEAKLAGELMQADEVVGAIANAATTFRCTLEGMPDRLAARIVGKSEGEISAMLAVEMESALEALSNSFQKIATDRAGN